MSLLGFLRRGRRDAVDVTVVGSGLPAVLVALELARCSRRVAVLPAAGTGGRPRSSGLGLVAVGPGAPYERVAGILGRREARSLWGAGRENVRRLRSFLEEARQDLGYEPRGTFLLAADRKEAEMLAESEDMLRDDGFPGEFLDHYMLETHFDVSGFAGAYWAAHGGELDPARLEASVTEAAREAGVAFLPAPARGLDVGSSGTVVDTDDGPVPASATVVAADAVAGDLVPGLLPHLRPAHFPRLGFVPEEGALLPRAARTADGRVAWQAGPAKVTLAAVGAAGAETADADRLEALPPRLHAAPGSERRWTEVGGVPSDGLPIVGSIVGSPLAVACGFGPLAPSLAFVAAAWIADAITGDRDPTPGPLRVGRDPVALGVPGSV